MYIPVLRFNKIISTHTVNGTINFPLLTFGTLNSVFQFNFVKIDNEPVGIAILDAQQNK